MEQFLNAMKAQATALDRSQAQPRYGIVSSVDPAAYTVRVLLQPESVLTGWLPVLSCWVGNGWGMTCLPLPGQPVLVLAQEGAADHGMVIAAGFSDATRPPENNVGEFSLRHKSGSSITLANDGTVRIIGDMYVAGSVHASAMVSDGTGTLNGLRQHHNIHMHTGVQRGGALSDIPNQMDP